MDDAWAYSIHIGLTDGCHERISRSALQQALPGFAPGGLVALPTSQRGHGWRMASKEIPHVMTRVRFSQNSARIFDCSS